MLASYYGLLELKLIKKYPEIDLFEYGFIWGLILGAVIAPVVEECLFRWQLRKAKVSIWFALISALLLVNYATQDDYAKFFGFVSVAVIVFGAYMIYEKLDRVKRVKVFRGYYVFLFYYTAIIFGYVHMFNTEGLTLADPSFLLYTSSQFVGALSMGYLRVRYGLGYSILLHFLFNVVMVTLSWFLRDL